MDCCIYLDMKNQRRQNQKYHDQTRRDSSRLKTEEQNILKTNYLSRNFQWQPRFHDRILRDEIELYNVRNYIANNPRNWYGDEFYEKAA